MVWPYVLVFVLTVAVDIVPFPCPPASGIMVLFQVVFDLNVWLVIAVGVIGSVAGRFILMLYLPRVSVRIFKRSKNEDVQYLGKRLQDNGWKSHAVILVYALLPLPTTPLFVAAGMAKLHPMRIIPAFFVGKLVADTVILLLGQEAAKSTEELLDGMVSWKAVVGLAVGLLLLLALLFFDWRTLLQRHRLRLKLNIWR